MESDCNRVQEEIAWGRLLDPGAQAHVLACPRCQETALGFAVLESSLDACMDGAVPDHFADAVMKRIAVKPLVGARFSFEKWLMDKMTAHNLRLQAAYLCGAALVLFAFLLPSAA
jgi:hypothetical protein